MKRHREQKGYLFKRSGVWYVRHHDNRIEGDQLLRKQVSTRIGLVEDFPSKADAMKPSGFSLPSMKPRTSPLSFSPWCSLLNESSSLLFGGKFDHPPRTAMRLDGVRSSPGWLIFA